MQLWLLLIGALLAQESVTANVVLLSAYQAHYAFWVINCIFVLASSFDIYIGYRFGRFVRSRPKQGGAHTLRTRMLASIERVLGRHGARLTITLFAFVNFAYFNAFLFSWLGFSVVDVFLFTFIGNLLWYTSEWLVVLGVTSLTPDPLTAIGMVLILSVVVVVIFRYAGRHLGGKRF